MQKLERVVGALREKLKKRPLAALQLYGLAIANKSDRGNHLKAVFEDEMEIARFGKEISREGLERKSALLFSSPRQSERELLVASCVAGLVNLGVQGAQDRLRAIGETFATFVLDGTQQQKFCGRLAIGLGLRSSAEIQPLLQTIVEPLIDALLVVLRVGAAPTRDSAVEGLGALLKFLPHPSARYPKYERPARADEDGDEVPEPERQVVIDQLYFDRLDRRRMMALAVAGDPVMREAFLAEVRRPISDRIEEAERKAGGDVDRLEPELLTILYTQADLLRTLPGLVRQCAAGERNAFQRRAVKYLNDAAVAREPVNAGDTVLRSFAHFQESVFRTIDVMIKRGATHEDFEESLAKALRETRRTLVGHSSVCNARVRATFALIQTTARLIQADREETAVKAELVPLFEMLAKPTPWPNLGIAEGCYYVVPFLAGNRWHEDIVKIALEQLFLRISSTPPPSDNLPEIHNQLIAAACFRRLILVLMQRTDEHSLTDRGSVRIKRDVSRLLEEPTIEEVLKAFRIKRTWFEIMNAPPSATTTGIVIAGTAFETDLLGRSSLFKEFDQRPSVKRLLLTRILAAQLRAASQDWREIERYDLLRQFWENMPTVSLAENERDDKVRELMADLPSRAAQAADPDLQDFFEHCSRRIGEEKEPRQELPGHVLAMISDTPSSRIADAIAREIDLNVLYGEQRGGCDLGKVLYQVALRGPSVSIFSRLLPRMHSERHRRIAELFKKHVKRVHAHSTMTAGEMLDHVDELIREIRQDEPSETLQKLKAILENYRSLFANEAPIWKAIEQGGLATLLRQCDEIVTLTQGSGARRVARQPLSEAFGPSAAQLESEVARYRELPVGEFEERAAALNRARTVARSLAGAMQIHAGLNPPERVMLVRLLQQLEDFFARTIHWYCDEPRYRKATRKRMQDPETFLVLFGAPTRTSLAAIYENSRNVLSDPGKPVADREAALKIQDEINRIAEAGGAIPPEFDEQRLRFEKVFVQWIESDLDVDMLQRTLRGRWAKPFAFAYRNITSVGLISFWMLLPCAIAIAFHVLGIHNEEGAGFFLLESAVLLAVFVSLIPRLRAGAASIWNHIRGRAAKPPGTFEEPYYFEALLPRLAQLIVVPLALTVELDHSYTFPLHASGWALLVLILLSFFTTRFFVDREIVDPSAVREGKVLRAPEKERVAKVVALALSHAFIIAVLLATIFGSHASDIEPADHEGLRHQFLETGHKHPYVAWILPRDVTFDLASAIGHYVEVSPKIGEHLKFTYYPTIILAWTALGLFVGVFLEGFVKGERLRGGEARDGEETASSAVP